MTTQEQMPTLAEMFPKPEETSRFARFAGEWALEGTLTLEGTPLPMTGSWTFTIVAGGWGVRGVMRSQVEGLGTYEEDDLVGFDQETGQFHVYSITNSAAVHDHVGGWTDPHTFEIAYEGRQGGKPYREMARVKFSNDATLEMESTDYVDGQLASVLAVTLRKR
jgi:hypothetical protein